MSRGLAILTPVLSPDRRATAHQTVPMFPYFHLDFFDHLIEDPPTISQALTGSPRREGYHVQKVVYVSTDGKPILPEEFRI